MFEIPIIFIPVGLVLVLIAFLFYDDRISSFRTGAVVFLTSYGLLLSLNGLAHGYEVASIGAIQVLFAFLVPPLGYLAFRGPTPVTPEGFTCLSGAILTFGVCWAFPFVIDPVLLLYGTCYAAALAYIAIKPSQMNSWVPATLQTKMRCAALLSAICILAVFIGDLLIQLRRVGVLDKTEGTIITMLSLISFGIVLLAGCLFIVKFPHSVSVDDYDTKKRDLNIILDFLNKTDAVSDPEYSLKRLARSMKMQPRYVSEIVNQLTGKNVSKLINDRRIAIACDKLKSTDEPIITIMMDAGFYTKSNFNREFKRVTGKAPSDWRKSNTGLPKGKSAYKTERV